MSAPSLSTTPLVTVIALCFNHARFVLECLESIRAQTFQDFELIVTDDKSNDNSPEIISDWLMRNYPQAKFIRHTENVGLCKTLNEAIRQSQGQFIAMIATDDTWEPNRLRAQLDMMSGCSEDVAVVYSDAYQMDETGKRLENSFLEAHGILGDPPQGMIFSRMADGNFIPAMATLIRRKALNNVGGYDETLTYEDFDMWLRLSDRYKFAFLPGKLANYRIVSTSIVRTIFNNPTPAHAYSVFIIAEKWLKTNRLTAAQRKRWSVRQANAAYQLYRHEDNRAVGCLLKSFIATHSLRLFLLAITHAIGLTRSRLKRIARLFGHTSV